jgi:hypothetical protein
MAIMATEKQGLDENLKGKVAFSLRGKKLEIPCILLKINESSPEKRYVIKFITDGKSEEIISHFIFQTQSEIIRELKEKSH